MHQREKRHQHIKLLYVFILFFSSTWFFSPVAPPFVHFVVFPLSSAPSSQCSEYLGEKSEKTNKHYIYKNISLIFFSRGWNSLFLYEKEWTRSKQTILFILTKKISKIENIPSCYLFMNRTSLTTARCSWNTELRFWRKYAYFVLDYVDSEKMVLVYLLLLSYVRMCVHSRLNQVCWVLHSC